MAKKTFFVKNFVAYTAVILIALLLAGFAFFQQINRHSMKENKVQLEEIAQNVSAQTALIMDNYSEVLDRFYQVSLGLTARDNGTDIMIVNGSGQIVLRANKDGVISSNGEQIDTAVINGVLEEDDYSERTTLGGIFEDANYVVGQVVETSVESDIVVLVCIKDEMMGSMMEQIMSSFIMIVSIALLGILLVSYAISSHITRPLKTMSIAAREFEQGDFSVRVPEENDCDEIDELALAFNNMASSLEKLEELTRGFIGNVSHEFKTPMTTIGGFVDGMIDGTIPEDKHQKYLRIISEEVHRLSRMVMRMLDASKIQSGELLLSPTPFNFTEMASQIILSFEQKIEGKEVEVEVEMDDKIMVLGDRDHVFRAVYNLVDNAVKFVDQGGSLRLYAKETNGYCEFSLINSGGGIPQNELPHIFDRFYKVDESRSRDRTGAGLGLYIVKNIINLHGGDISVSSSNGETEFDFTLPLVKNDDC